MMNNLRRGAIATAVCAMISGSAQAGIFDYGFNVFNNNTAFNMSTSPFMFGTVQVDNSLSGFAAITSFSFYTGDKEWTLAQVNSGETTFDSFGVLTKFFVQFSDTFGYGHVDSGYSNSNGGANVVEYETLEGNSCSSCVYLSSVGTPVTTPVPEVTTPVPEPETYAMMLAGLGLLGVMTRRRKQKLNA